MAKEVYKPNEVKQKRVKLVTQGHDFEGKYDIENMSEVTTNLAKEVAEYLGLDLIIVADGEIPTCKMLDYNKMQYQAKKSQKKAQKVVLKEVKFGCNIADHDLMITANKIQKMLDAKNKVRVVIQFRGRQVAYAKVQAPVLLNKLLKELGLELVKEPKLENNTYTYLLE